MTTCRDIVNRALRHIGAVPRGGGAQAPDMAQGIQALNDLIEHLRGYGAAHPWLSQNITAAVQIPRDCMGARMQMTGGGVAVTLPPNPRDGARISIIDVAGTFDTSPATVAPQGMKFDGSQGSGGTITLNTAGLNRSWMFRADLGDWLPISELRAVDDMPYPREHDRGFGAMLAVDMYPDYFGAEEELPPVVVSMAKNGAEKLAAQYVPALPMVVEPSLLWNFPGANFLWGQIPYQNYFGP